MGLFGVLKKRLKDGSLAAGFAAAGAAAKGDHGTAAQIQSQFAQQRSAMRKAEQEQEEFQRTYGYARSQGMSDEEARIAASSGVVSDMVKQKYAPPANNDTINDYKFIEQQLGPEVAKQYLRNLGDPTVTTVLPGNRVYSGPRSQLGSALGAPAPGVQPGHVEEGFRFKGGNPGDPNAWEPVGQQGGPQGSPLSGGFLGRH